MNEQKQTGKKRLSLRRLKALIIKEFFQIVRDPSSILIAAVLPLFLIFVYGTGVSLDSKNLEVGLVLEDTNPNLQSFADSLKNSTFFSIDVARTIEELTPKLISGKLKGIVTVPFYFSEFQERGDIAPIFVVADGSEPNTASFVQNYVQSAFTNWETQEIISQALQQPPSVQLQSRYWFNEELNSHFFLIPGSLALIMTLIGTLLTALVVTREWEKGTMEALMTTPVTMLEIVLGKLIPYFCLGMGSMTICTIVAYYGYGVPFRGSYLVLALVTGFFLLTALGTGLLISFFTKNQFTASQIAIVVAFLPSFMLSGLIFEISSMPTIIRLSTYLVPAKYFVSSLETLFLAGNIWKLILLDIGAMVVYTIIIFIMISLKIVKRLD
ncbi:MAG: ABC transporter permease [Chlamydiae bacterium]|nr:ABC transporter permease [Chlamydiota bacterium]